MWPANEMRPQEWLGSSYVALDPLRMFFDCYIVYEPQDSAFKILPTADAETSLKKVREVLKRLRVVLCECATKRSAPLKMYLVNPGQFRYVCQSVEMIEPAAAVKNRLRGTMRDEEVERSKIAVFAGSSLSDELKIDWEEQKSKILERNEQIMQRATASCLSRLVYHRGRVHMRTDIGLCLLRQYKQRADSEMVPFDKFVHNLEGPQVRGNLLRM